jgi:hypothetical protein
MMEWLGSIGNYAANAVVGANPGSSYVVHDFRDDHDLLSEWGQVCRCEFRWQPSWGDTSTVLSAKHPTPEAASAEARRMALQSGYRAPHRWEFWRWHERPLPT